MQHGAAAELLARSPLFGGLSGDLLRSIVERCALKQIGAGQMITIAGTPADSAHLILEGEVALHDPRGRPLGETRGPGALLDEMAMFVETEHYPGAAAASNSWLLDIPRTVIGQLLMEHPHLAAHFAMNTRANLARIAETLRQLDGMLLESSRALDAIHLTEDDRPPLAAGKQETGGDEAREGNGHAAEVEEEPDRPESRIQADFSPREALASLAQKIAPNGNGDADHGGMNGNGHANGGHNGSAGRATDLLAQLNAAFSQESRTPRELAHDRTAFPSRGLRPPLSGSEPPTSGPGLPIRDRDGDRDSMLASRAPGSSTK